MDSSLRPPCGQQQPTMADIVRYLEGAAQCLTWLHFVEEQRQPALAAAAFHLNGYASAARQAADENDTETLDEFVTLRLGALASLLAVIRDRWASEARPVTVWVADTLAEIAHWIDRAREAISQALIG